MEAAGFAAAIVAFIDFSCKIVKGSYDLYQSPTGTSEEHVHIDTIVKDLTEVAKGLTPASAASTNPSRHQEALQKLALECQNVAEELTKTLEDLKRKDGNKAWRSLEAKWKAMRQEPVIASLEKRLDRYQSRVMMRLQLILEEKQDAVRVQMEAMEQSHVRNADSTTRKLEEISSSIQKLGAQVAACIDAEDQSDSITKLVDDLGNILKNLALAPTQTPADIRILNRLYFKTMFTRQQSIAEASYGTFKWLLDEEPPALSREYVEEIFGQIHKDQACEQRVTTIKAFIPRVQDDLDNRVRVYSRFQHWLNAGGAFHVSGKAGSGKSTLMRCLVEDPRLKTRLEHWASGKKLVFASFFFSRLGDDDQKSLSGFYRSILFSVLEKCSDLIKDVFPAALAATERQGAQWQDNPFTTAELRHALDILIGDNSTISRFGDCRFCFFVDGLDEYDGDSSDHFELAEQLKRWADSPVIQICASSRPHIEFLDVFDEESRIYLHQATSLDILRLIHGELRKAKLLEHLMSGSGASAGSQNVLTASDLLARELSKRANGVFLWVRLAIKSIHHGKRHRYSIQRLQENIQKLPAELDPLFDQMLQGVRSEDKQLSARLLLLLTTKCFDYHRRYFTLLMVSYIDHLDDESFPFSSAIGNIPREEMRERLETGRCLLQSLTMGLFESKKSISELVKDEQLPKDCPQDANDISALHSTVLEYLRTPVRQQALHAKAGAFDMHDAFVRLRLATLMANPTRGANYFFDCLLYVLHPGSDKSGQISRAAFDKMDAVRSMTVQEMHERLVAKSGRPCNDSGDDSDEVAIDYGSEALKNRMRRDSFVLSMAAGWGQVDIVTAKVKADKTLLSRVGGQLNLLFTACHYRNTRLVAALLDLGASPMDAMVVYDQTIPRWTTIDRRIKVTVWSVFLWAAFFDNPDINNPDFRLGLEFYDILRLMLQRSPDLDIIFRFATNSSLGTSGRSVALPLESMLKILNPSDLDKFLVQIKEIREHGGGQSKEITLENGLEAFGPDDLMFQELEVGDQVLRGLKVIRW